MKATINGFIDLSKIPPCSACGEAGAAIIWLKVALCHDCLDVIQQNAPPPVPRAKA